MRILRDFHLNGLIRPPEENSGCLSATPAFGQLGIDIFVEKLTAGSPVTKVRCDANENHLFPNRVPSPITAGYTQGITGVPACVRVECCRHEL